MESGSGVAMVTYAVVREGKMERFRELMATRRPVWEAEGDGVVHWSWSQKGYQVLFNAKWKSLEALQAHLDMHDEYFPQMREVLDIERVEASVCEADVDAFQPFAQEWNAKVFVLSDEVIGSRGSQA